MAEPKLPQEHLMDAHDHLVDLVDGLKRRLITQGWEPSRAEAMTIEAVTYIRVLSQKELHDGKS